TVTDPDGFTITYAYDGFGRVITESNNNGLQNTFEYKSSLGVGYWPALARYVITNTSNTGTYHYSFYDELGRLVREATKGFGGQVILSDKEYNYFGQLYRETKPYFEGGTPQNTTYTYDIRGRLTQANRP